MSDVSQGLGWWQASDGRWYPSSDPTVPPAASYQPVAPPSTNGVAVTSLVLGILALVTYAVASILGPVTGVIARRQIKASTKFSSVGSAVS
jgi:hypothetical protein